MKGPALPSMRIYTNFRSFITRGEFHFKIVVKGMLSSSVSLSFSKQTFNPVLKTDICNIPLAVHRWIFPNTLPLPYA